MKVWLCSPESTLKIIRSLDTDDWERLQAILVAIRDNPWIPGVDCTAIDEREFVARFSLRHIIVWRICVLEPFQDTTAFQLLHLNETDDLSEIDVQVQVLLETERRYRTPDVAADNRG